MAPPQPQPARPAHTFSALVNGVIAHPLFALVVKKVFDVCGSKAFESSHLIPHFTETEGNATGLQHFAETHGLGTACERWTSTDVFMSAMVAALNQVNAVGSGGHVALRHTIETGQKALTSTWTDPRFVGATDNRRLEEAQRVDQVQPNNGIQRQDSRNHSNAIQRSDDLQRPVGMQKPVHGTRRPLSETAKQTLERWFHEHLKYPYPTPKEKEELASLCSVSLSSVNNWFGNKRMRIKRKMVAVPSTEASPIVDNVLAPTQKWHAVVVSKLRSEQGREVLANATGRAVSVIDVGDNRREGNSARQAPNGGGTSGSGRTEGTQ